MENTETNYTTNRTLMAYYKSNIDVQINWLLFLNSFKSISNKKSFMEVAPILEEIRNRLYTSFEFNLIPDNMVHINTEIKNVIGELFDEYDISDAKEYIEKDLFIKDIINLSTAIFIRQELANLKIDELMIQGIKIPSEEVRFILESLKQIKYEKVTTSTNIEGYSKELLKYYFESLKISSDDTVTLQNYIYTVLELIKGIDFMYARLVDNKNTGISLNVNFLLKSFWENMYLTSNFSLASIFDELNELLENIMTLIKEDKITLKKHI